MSDRHTSRRLKATKEFFFPFTGGSGGAASTAFGAHIGWLVNGDNQYTYAECIIPWDFKFLTRSKVVFLAEANLTPMTFRVVTDFCKSSSTYLQGNNLIYCAANTIQNFIQEYDISAGLVDLTSRGTLENKEYLGVQVSRQSGENTNAIFLGVRIRYNTPLHAKTP